MHWKISTTTTTKRRRRRRKRKEGLCSMPGSAGTFNALLY
jgi:hypothetical protein